MGHRCSVLVPCTMAISCTCLATALRARQLWHQSLRRDTAYIKASVIMHKAAPPSPTLGCTLSLGVAMTTSFVASPVATFGTTGALEDAPALLREGSPKAAM